MRRIISLILILMLLLTSCTANDSHEHIDTNQSTTTTTPTIPTPSNPDDGDEHDCDGNHSYQSVVVAPSCNAEGYTTYTCTSCGDSYVSDITDAIGHKYDDIVVDPTCTVDGYTIHDCSACDFSYIDSTVGATGHDYKSVVTTSTCENHGYTTYTCAKCKDSYVEHAPNASGHGYTSSTTAPTCSKEGYTTYTCTSCGESYIADKVAPLGHNYKSTTVAPTCTSNGYTIYVCLTCNDTYTSNLTDAKGHSYKSSVTAPTCVDEGYTTYTCSECNNSYVSDKVASTGHKLNSTVTNPTCEEMGYTTYVCITCSHSYISDQVSALGHTWKDATTQAPKTCSTCGETEGDKLAPTVETLYVNYINVGQGDSILIKVGDCDILIDAGTASYGSTVSSYLKSKGVDDIELMVNTHPDSDHCGGLTQVLKDYAVEEVWISKNTDKSTAAYTNFTSAIKSEGLTAKKPDKGTVYTYEYLTLTVLYSEIGSDANNSSIVIMLEYGSFRFLFMGDAGEEVENKLVSSGADLNCDVLKVGHHGSKTSSTANFLAKASAEYGVICVGNNSYGHPTSQATGRLTAAGVSYYTTQKHGNVVFSTNGSILYLPNGSTDTTGSGTGSLPSGGSSSGGSSSGGSSSGSSSGSTTYDIFIGNTETKVFHLPTCSNLPAASKQNTMYNYWWIINIAGYTPCGRCLKNYAGVTTYILNTESNVYHLSTCSYLPASSKQKVITDTTGYKPCGHCIK